MGEAEQAGRLVGRYSGRVTSGDVNGRHVAQKLTVAHIFHPTDSPPPQCAFTVCCSWCCLRAGPQYSARQCRHGVSWLRRASNWPRPGSRSRRAARTIPLHAATSCRTSSLTRKCVSWLLRDSPLSAGLAVPPDGVAQPAYTAACLCASGRRSRVRDKVRVHPCRKRTLCVPMLGCCPKGHLTLLEPLPALRHYTSC